MGNYSRPPDEMLSKGLAQGYLGVHFEQGVPLLDRDLNLMQDLLTARMRAALTDHVGDGIAGFDDAFKILPATDGADDDFLISAGSEPPGRFLAGGIPVTITRQWHYKEQPLPPLPPLDGDVREDLVYLDAWIDEVSGDSDSSLRNPDDVGIQTSVRQQNQWLVRVQPYNEGETPLEPDEGHVNIPLAVLRRKPGEDEKVIISIRDLRRTRLSLADLVNRVSRAFTPSFVAPGHQVRPAVGIGGSRLVVSGRNVDFGYWTTATFDQTEEEPGPQASLERGTAPGEVVVTVPDVASGASSGLYRIRIENDFGATMTDDTVTILGSTQIENPPDAISAALLAMNDNGLAAGFLKSSLLEPRPCVWERVDGVWQMTELPLPNGFTVGLATDVNASGQVVGNAFVVPNPSATRSILWDRSGASWSATVLPDGEGFWACAVNDQLTIAGYGGTKSCIWLPDAGSWRRVELPALPNTSSARVTALNNAGIAVGYCSDRPTIWYPSAGEYRLGQLEWNWLGQALSVNDAGQVTGFLMGGLYTRAFLWSTEHGGQILPGVAGAPAGKGCKVNANGLVLGFCEQVPRTDKRRLVLWDRGLAVELTQLAELGDPGDVNAGLNARGEVATTFDKMPIFFMSD